MTFKPGLEWSEEPPIQWGDTEIRVRLIVRAHGSDWWLQWDSKNGLESVLMPFHSRHGDRAIMERDVLDFAASRTPELAPEPMKAVVYEARDIAAQANAHCQESILEVAGSCEYGLPVLHGKITALQKNADRTQFRRFTCGVVAVCHARDGWSLMAYRHGNETRAEVRIETPEQLADCAHELALRLQSEMGMLDDACPHSVLPSLSHELQAAGFDLHHWEAGTDPDEPDEFRIVAYGWAKWPEGDGRMESEVGIWLEDGKLLFSGLMCDSYQCENQYGSTAAECVEALERYYAEWHTEEEGYRAEYDAEQAQEVQEAQEPHYQHDPRQLPLCVDADIPF